MAGFVGGKGLSLFLAGFSLSVPLLSLSFLGLSCFVFASSKSDSLSLCVSPDLSLSLSRSVCCQLELHFLHGPYLFHPHTSPSLSFFDSSFLFVPNIHPSLPPFPASSLHLIYLLLNNLSCLISLFPASFSTTSYLLFFCSSQLCVSLSSLPPSQLLPLCLISDAVY